MYNIPFILSVLVNLCLISSAKGDDAANGQYEVIYNFTSQGQNVTLNDNVKFHFQITRDENNRVRESCTIRCNINDTNTIEDSQCNVVLNTQPSVIDVVTKRNVTKQDGGKWNCEYTLQKIETGPNDTEINVDMAVKYTFQVNIKSKDSSIVVDWKVIVIGVSILVILIIIGQTICIIHFRKKAEVVRRQARWTSMTSSVEDPDKTGNVRYSKMPVQKNKVEERSEARESGIYEALENIRVSPAPAPPSLQTLPKKDVSHNSTPPAVSPESSSARTFTNGMNSLLRNKSKKPKEPKEPENKRTTIERIKERPPQPLPEPEDLYESVENSPLPPRKAPVRKEKPRKEVPKKEEFRAFPTGARPKFLPPGQGPVNLGNGSQSLQSQVLPSQLKEAFATGGRPKYLPSGHGQVDLGNGSQSLQSKVLPSQLKDELRKRVNTVILEPPKQNNLPLRGTPFSHGHPSPVASSKPLLAPPVPRPLKSTPATPVSSGPRIKPPPPVKPKQLHPLPPTPQSRPESIHVVTERCDDDDDNSDEDWTYEPLPEYPIYSI